MAYCTNCGSNIKEDSKFCYRCGNPVDGSPAVPPPVSAVITRTEIQKRKKIITISVIAFAAVLVLVIAGVVISSLTDGGGSGSKNRTNYNDDFLSVNGNNSYDSYSSRRNKTCSYCGGNGKITCNTCGGKGTWDYTYNIPNYGGNSNAGRHSESKSCQYCHGTGYKDCPHC